MDKTIEVNELTKYYEDLLAVDHISFTVNRGEVFGFLGPNGAGKTTTIRMLTGLLRPSAGTAKIMGFDIKREITRVKKAIGVVPDVSNLYDELTALDNLIFMAQLYGVPKEERLSRAEGLLELFDLAEKKLVLFGSLSRGMKRRLTIAASLVHKPEVIFLDEPTSGLDVMNARVLRNTILRLRQRGVTIFLTTHNIEEANILCDRIAIIVKGRIIALETPRGLKAKVEEEPIIEVGLGVSVPDLLNTLKGVGGVLDVTRINGGTLRLRVADIPAALPAVVARLDSLGSKITFLNTNRSTLEDAFVKLTGLNREIMLADKAGKKM
jgi:ABC-2 type transport system ATP-binding protein